MRNITPRNLLYVNSARESFSYEDTFKGQFSQPPPEDDEFTPLYYYKCFWDNNISEPIAHQINLYIVQQTGTSIANTAAEIKIFFEIKMTMVLIKMPQ